MRDSFAAYCTEKRQHTVQAKSDIELLKEVKQCLVQTAAELQQQVTLIQQEHFKDIQCIDARITGIKNAINTLAKSTQTTPTNVHDIKSHIEVLHHSLESSTKQTVTDTVNSAL